MKRLAWLLLLINLVTFARERHQDARHQCPLGPNTHFSVNHYSSLSEWEVRKRQLKDQILEAAGLVPLPERRPLHPQIFGRIEREGYSVEKVWIETLPGYFLAGNLYRPFPDKGIYPGVLIPHGHWKHGRAEDIASYSVPVLAANLARQGYVAFAYDMVGYNDTQQVPKDFRSSPVELLWSFGPLGLQLWNSIRGLDFLQSLSEVDGTRIGVTGASGGGTQTFLLAAVDDRVSVSVPVNMVSAHFQGDARCENAPGLRHDTNNVEIAAVMAPKPQLLVSATGDWTKHVPEEEYPAMREIYSLYGSAENLKSVQISAGHNYNRQSREAVYAYFRRTLQHSTDQSPIREAPLATIEREKLLILPGEPHPASRLDKAGLFGEWQSMSSAQLDRLTPEQLRRRLSLALDVEWPIDTVTARLNGSRIALARKSVGDNVPGIWLQGHNNRAALVVHPGGAEAARNSQEVRELISEGVSVLLLDVFQTGSAKVAGHHQGEFHTTFYRSDDACRVQDILTGLAYLQKQGIKAIRLVGLDKAAIWAEFGAALAPIPLEFASRLEPVPENDDLLVKNFFVPGIQRAGGLEAAERLVRFSRTSQQNSTNGAHHVDPLTQATQGLEFLR